MININKLDEANVYTPEGERELLDRDPELVRAFYSLTGQARKEYAIQLAEAEAERIRTLRAAQADGIREIRKAEAEGLKSIIDVLSQCPDANLAARLVELIATQDVAQSLAEGKATKLFLPHNLSDLFGLLAGMQEVSTENNPGNSDKKPMLQSLNEAKAVPAKKPKSRRFKKA